MLIPWRVVFPYFPQDFLVSANRGFEFSVETIEFQGVR